MNLDDTTLSSAEYFRTHKFRFQLSLRKKSKTPESGESKDVPTPEEPTPRFRLSDGHRDSLYSLLSAIGSACPIPAISPCITLIKEIDSTFRRARLQL